MKIVSSTGTTEKKYIDYWSQILTVPAVDLDDKKVLCFKRDNPKSHTCI